jgi:hypothetical protein
VPVAAIDLNQQPLAKPERLIELDAIAVTDGCRRNRPIPDWALASGPR